MSNLENLTEKILEEAKMQSDAMLREAKAFEDDVVMKKVKEAKEKKEKMLEKGRFEANLLKERIISNAEVNRR
ncbi:MAG TPA: V-type ATP synthase subunit E, partial [Clostridiaceae bacterium]|nr:V-type ATP synthase subunit E [Clostridiaceae bacterium]